MVTLRHLTPRRRTKTKLAPLGGVPRLTRFRSTSAAAEDRRRVQTAVKGKTADSNDAVELPIEHEAARRFRQEHDGVDFWCGTLNGCGRQLIIRIGDHKIPHFYHLVASDVQCRLVENNRGRLNIEPPIVLDNVQRWRSNRGLPEGNVDFFDPIKDHDARYMHISGPPGTRDTRLVLGDITIVQVLEDAKSPQGREWDWFVHHRNSELRAVLQEQGISYAQIRFTPTKTSAIMQVFLTTEDNVGDWGQIERYRPAPNRPPRPPKPPALRTPSPVAVPAPAARVPTPSPVVDRAFSAPARSEQWHESAREMILQAKAVQTQGHTARPRSESRAAVNRRRAASGPKLELAPASGSTPKPQDENPPAVDPYDARLDRQQQRLEIALTSNDRQDIRQLARDLKQLVTTHGPDMSSRQKKRARDLLAQARR